MLHCLIFYMAVRKIASLSMSAKRLVQDEFKNGCSQSGEEDTKSLFLYELTS